MNYSPHSGGVMGVWRKTHNGKGVIEKRKCSLHFHPADSANFPTRSLGFTALSGANERYPHQEAEEQRGFLFVRTLEWTCPAPLSSLLVRFHKLVLDTCLCSLELIAVRFPSSSFIFVSLLHSNLKKQKKRLINTYILANLMLLLLFRRVMLKQESLI